MDASTERGVAQLKLAWWQEEVRRLAAGAGVHPISRYLQALPRAASVDFRPLTRSVEAAALEVSGAPLKHAAELPGHADALFGLPLMVAAGFQSPGNSDDDPGVLRRMAECTAALAAGDYLLRALRDYRRAMSVGRVVFPIDELLAADIENADLICADPPARLARYLDRLGVQARACYAATTAGLPAACRSRQRHLLVMAALGLSHLQRRTPTSPLRRMQDMLLAWSTARRAVTRVPEL